MTYSIVIWTSIDNLTFISYSILQKGRKKWVKWKNMSVCMQKYSYNIIFFTILLVGKKQKKWAGLMNPELFVVKPRATLQSTPYQTCTKSLKLNLSTNANWCKTCWCQSGIIKSSPLHFVSVRGWIYYLANIWVRFLSLHIVHKRDSGEGSAVDRPI